MPSGSTIKPQASPASSVIGRDRRELLHRPVEGSTAIQAGTRAERAQPSEAGIQPSNTP
jgi:hypothetical protein